MPHSVGLEVRSARDGIENSPGAFDRGFQNLWTLCLGCYMMSPYTPRIRIHEVHISEAVAFAHSRRKCCYS
jgi:hypothetical protein